MKKLLSSLLALVMCMVLSVSVFGTDVADADVPEVEYVRQGLQEHIAIMESGTYISISVSLYDNSFFTQFKAKNEVIDQQKTELTETINKLCDIINSSYEDRAYIGYMADKSVLAACEFVLNYKDENGEIKQHNIRFTVKEGVVYIRIVHESNKEITIPLVDSTEIVNFISAISLTDYEVRGERRDVPEVKYELEISETEYNQIYTDYRGQRQSETYIMTDSIDFTFAAPAEYDNKVIYEVALAGEEITARYEKYKNKNARNKFYHHLILSGSKGMVELRINEYTSFDGQQELYSYNFPISFINNQRVEGDAYVEYAGGKHGQTKVKLIFAGGELEQVRFDDKIVCGNLVYKNYSGESSLSDRYIEKTEEDKEAMIKEQQESAQDVPAQDPERYVSTYKGTRNDGRVLDYTINFIAELPIDFSGVSKAYWFKELGEDVTVTLVGMNYTIDGKSFSNGTMVRFKGSNGELWFKISESQWSGRKSSVTHRYHSLISFDGTTAVQNTLEYDVVQLEVFFEGEDMELAKIAVKAGGSTASIDAENINYIGGGKAVYENI